MDAWRRMIAAQGGDPDAPLPEARESHVVSAGERLTVLVGKDFTITGTETGPGGGPGRGGHGGRFDGPGRGGPGGAEGETPTPPSGSTT